MFDRIFIMTERILFTDVEVYHSETIKGGRIYAPQPSKNEVRQTREYRGAGKGRERRHSKPQGRKTRAENQSMRIF